MFLPVPSRSKRISRTSLDFLTGALAQQGACLKELHIDRAYLSSHLVHERSHELEIYCKAWPVREGKRFFKQAFTLDWEQQVIRCPAEQEMPFVSGGIVHFPKDTCAQCSLKTQCTTSAKGGSGYMVSDERDQLRASLVVKRDFPLLFIQAYHLPRNHYRISTNGSHLER
jgi:hypothetical protein